MFSYYNKIRGSIAPGNLARSEDIHAIQDSVTDAIASAVSQNFGNAYIVDAEKNAFSLRPVSTIYDQQNTEEDEDLPVEKRWFPLHNLYIRQPFVTTKSSINTMEVRFRNITTQDITIWTEIRSFYDDEPLTTYSITIPKNTHDKEFNLIFNLNSVPPGLYYLYVHRVNVSGIEGWLEFDPAPVSILYDASKSYRAINPLAVNVMEEVSLEVSDDGVDFEKYKDETEADLWFRQTYATEGLSYNLTPGLAVIEGTPVISMDTHVTVPDRSVGGDRIDAIVLTQRGNIQVRVGDVSTTAPPIPEIQSNELLIALIRVYRDRNKLNVLMQDDEGGLIRPRSLREKIRRLESEMKYINRNYIPKRVKYTRSPNEFLDVAESHNVSPITYLGVVIAYQLGGINIEDYYWALRHFQVRDHAIFNGVSYPRDDVLDAIRRVKDFRVKFHRDPNFVYVKDDRILIKDFLYVMEPGFWDEGRSPIDGMYEREDGIASKVGVKLDISKGNARLSITPQLDDWVRLNWESTQKAPLEGAPHLAGNFLRTYTVHKDNKENSEYPVGWWDNHRYGSFKTVKVKGIKTIIDGANLRLFIYRTPIYGGMSQHQMRELAKNLPGAIVIGEDTHGLAHLGGLTVSQLSGLYSQHNSYLSYRRIENNELIARSEPINLSQFPRQEQGGSSTNVINIPQETLTFNFPDDVDVISDRYMLALVLEPETSTASMTLNYTLFSVSQGAVPRRYLGTFPPSTMSVASNTGPGGLIGLDWRIQGQSEGYNTEGFILSDTIEEESNIGSVEYDINSKIPPNTSIEVELSNDGGNTWELATGGRHTFQKSGTQFKWKIRLRTTDPKVTPEIIYSEDKNYAIKFRLGVEPPIPEEQPVSGALVTMPFDGNELAREALEAPDVIDSFSHWDYARVWMSENLGRVTMDIDATNTAPAGNPEWNFVKQNIESEDMSQQSIDYSHYDVFGEDDEYNYQLTLDPNRILVDRDILIDSCITNGVANVGSISVDDSDSMDGAASLKWEASEDYGNVLLFHKQLERETDLSRLDSISFYFKPSIVTNTGELKFRLCLTDNCEGQAQDFDIVGIGIDDVDEWNLITIPLSNQDALKEVKAFGIVNNGTTFANEDTLHIDHIHGTDENRKLLFPGNIAWTSTSGAKCVTNTLIVDDERVSSFNFGSSGNKPVQGSLAKIGFISEIYNYPELKFRVRSSIKIPKGVLSLRLMSDVDGEGYILQDVPIPALEEDVYTNVFTTLKDRKSEKYVSMDNPENIATSTAPIKSIVLMGGGDVEMMEGEMFYIESIHAFKSSKIPIYQQYMRYRFNLSRTNPTDISPSVRKVGAVFMLR